MRRGGGTFACFRQGWHYTFVSGDACRTCRTVRKPEKTRLGEEAHDADQICPLRSTVATDVWLQKLFAARSESLSWKPKGVGHVRRWTNYFSKELLVYEVGYDIDKRHDKSRWVDNTRINEMI